MLIHCVQSFSKTKSSEDIFVALTKSILFPEGGRQDKRTAHVGYRHLLGKDVLRTEFVPLLNRIISPNIRPVRFADVTRFGLQTDSFSIAVFVDRLG